MRVLVTGATGVVGRRLVPLLTSAGHQVTALARTAQRRLVLARAGAQTLELDLLSPERVRSAAEGHDAIVNLATHMPASSWQTMFRGAWRENDRVRREGSANLVDAALEHGVARFVQESFAPAYPDRGGVWIDESTPLAPIDYNRTILDAEASLARFAAGGGSGVVLRFGDFYGPDARLLADLIRLVRRGWAPLPGDPGAFISSVSHDDAASAVFAALALPPGTYNVVDDEPVTHRAFFDALAGALGVPPPRLPPRWVTPLFGTIGRLLARSQRISNLRLRSASAWTPRFASVREGWPATIAAMKLPGLSRLDALAPRPLE